MACAGIWTRARCLRLVQYRHLGEHAASCQRRTLSLKTDEWLRMLDVNIGGVLNTVAAVLPHMIARKSGHIVNMSSIAGRKVFQGLSVYCATKHAVAALSDGMELAPNHNIRVTCIQPGAVETEPFEHVSDTDYRATMEGLRDQMKFISAGEVGETIAFALEARFRHQRTRSSTIPHSGCGRQRRLFVGCAWRPHPENLTGRVDVRWGSATEARRQIVVGKCVMAGASILFIW